MSLQEKLKAEFPEFYSELEFECGPGWYYILRDLSLKIKEHLNSSSHGEGIPFSVLQIKEKYGELRFYVGSCCSHIHEMIEEAKDRSQETCENCGKHGTMRTLENNSCGWVYTRCDDCWKELEKKNKPFLELQ